MEGTGNDRPVPKHPNAGLSREPGEQKAKAPRAPAARRRKAGRQPPAGPGGLGYVLALDDREAGEIDWHGEEHQAHAPPAPRQGH